MVIYANRSLYPPESVKLEPAAPPAPPELDAALLALRDGDPARVRSAFAALRAAGREAVAARMKEVRAVPEGRIDAMGQSRVHDCPAHEETEKAIILQCSGGWQGKTQKLIDTLRRYGRCADARIVVFAADDGAWQYFRNRDDVLTIRCSLFAKPRSWMKTAMYLAGELVKAQKLLLLESDFRCVGDLSPLWSAIDAADHRAILGARGQFLHGFRTLTDDIKEFGGEEADLEFITGRAVPHGCFHFNGGMLACTSGALRRAERKLRSYYPFLTLAGEALGMCWMDELGLMCAVSEIGFLGYLHTEFNHTIYYQDNDLKNPVNWTREVKDGELLITTNGRPSRLVHFAGVCKDDLMEAFDADLERYPVVLAPRRAPMQLFTFACSEWGTLRRRFLQTLKDAYEVTVLPAPVVEKVTHAAGLSIWLHKTRIIIECVEQHMGETILFTDIDIQFFGPTQPLIEETMRGCEIAVQFEQGNGVNIGFIAIHCAPRTLEFFHAVLRRIEATGEWDQKVIREMLEGGALRWSYLDKRIWAYGWEGNIPPVGVVAHHSTCCAGQDEKIKQMERIAGIVRDRG